MSAARTCGCDLPGWELCAHEWDQVRAEMQERGTVVWHDSMRGGPGVYTWELRVADGDPLTGYADDEQEAWRAVRDRIADTYRDMKRRAPRSSRWS